jgi:glucosylceramidase
MKYTIALFLQVSFFCSFAQVTQQASIASNNILSKKITIFTTAQNTNLKLSPTGSASFKLLAQPVEGEISIFVDPSKQFQTLLGIGGAITDASAETFAKLSKQQQAQFIEAYYSKEKGIGYSLARTTIHSSDFSSDSYTYVKEGDSSLKSFTIEHDKKFRIPFIKAAIQAAGGRLTIFASPWSPPAFMKTNGEMLHGGKLHPAFRQSWANYYTKFIKAYEKEGIPVWGISIQNEPMATQKWESCIYTAEEERDFLKNYLGPTMQKAGLAAKKIIVWDHNRDLMTHRANVIFDDPMAAKYAWGMGFHWYETWSGGTPMFDNVALVHKTYPNKHLLFTEGCGEKFDYAKLNDWSLGERYGQSMIHDFNNGTEGFTDWNILLDENGGPNHVGNWCFAPIHADLKKGTLIFTNAYYYIGHFSKFVQPGAKVISSSSSRSALISCAFMNPDKTIHVVVMNQTAQAIKYNVCIGRYAAIVDIQPHAIQTLEIKD